MAESGRGAVEHKEEQHRDDRKGADKYEDGRQLKRAAKRNCKERLRCGEQEVFCSLEVFVHRVRSLLR